MNNFNIAKQIYKYLSDWTYGNNYFAQSHPNE